MKVISVVPRGYCKGVVRAINMAKKSIDNAPQPISILGMIVHNQYIVDALKDIGIQTIEKPGSSRDELLDEIQEGTVIITAHGCDDQVIQKAKDKGLHVINATCLDVIKTHDLIKDYLAKDYDILYIGKDGHPESQGALSINPQRIHLIENKESLNGLNPHKKYMMTNQTTMSLFDVYSLCETAKQQFDHVEIAQEICNATQIRQEAIANIDQEVDIVFIVGDPHSNNTKKLASIAKEKAHKETYMIETVNDIDIELLKEKRCAAVSSGASTPTYLTNQVIEYLQGFDYQQPSSYQKPEIKTDQIIK